MAPSGLIKTVAVLEWNMLMTADIEGWGRFLPLIMHTVGQVPLPEHSLGGKEFFRHALSTYECQHCSWVLLWYVFLIFKPSSVTCLTRCHLV